MIKAFRDRGHAPRSWGFILLLGAWLLGAPPGAALDLPLVTVTASPWEEASRATPGTVTVLRPEESEGEGKTLGDLLEQSAGVHVIRVEGRGGYVVASIRGSTGAQVAVYVDGVLMNLGGEGAVNLATIPADTVERIEVYRGFVPGLFGASGLGAVISVHTRRPRGFEGAAAVELEDFGTWKTSLRYGNDLGSGRYFAAVTLGGTAGDFPYHNDHGTFWNLTDDYEARRRNNGARDRNVLFAWEDRSWRLRGEYLDQHREIPRRAPGNDRPGDPPGPELDTVRTSLGIGQEFSGERSWGWQAQVLRQDKEFFDPRDPRTLPAPQATWNHHRTERFSLSTHRTQPLGRGSLTFAGEAFRESLRVEGDMVARYRLRSRYDQEVLNLALEGSFPLGSRGRVVPSVRWNGVDGTGHLSWSLGAEWDLTGGWGAHLSYGRAFRAPTLYERFGDGALLLPRPNLRWEDGIQWDAGVRYEASMGKTRFRGSMTYFHRDVTDLIEFVMANAESAYYDNIGQSTVDGVEVEGAWALPRWQVNLAYTWMRSENLSPGARYGKPLPNRPTHAAHLRVVHDLSDHLSAFVEGKFVGGNAFDQTGDLAMSDLTTVDLGISWTRQDGGVVTAGVRDLFDAASEARLVPFKGPEQMPWYPSAGRTWFLSLRWSW